MVISTLRAAGCFGSDARSAFWRTEKNGRRFSGSCTLIDTGAQHLNQSRLSFSTNFWPSGSTAEAILSCSRLDVGIDLRRRRFADVEGPVIAGAIALIALQDVKERLIAGAEHAVGEVMRMRVAALARNGVDRFHIVRAPLVEELRAPMRVQEELQ